LTNAVIRPATRADIERIAFIHVQAWRETYRGLVPDALLAELSVEQRVRVWSDMLGAGERAPAILVADIDGTIVGFGSACRTRNERLGTEGEVTSIYLLDGSKRRGIGRRLFVGLLAWLGERGCRSVGLWVLDTNSVARRFYEAMGGRTGPTKIDQRTDTTLHEIGYVWDDVRSTVVRLQGIR
jgi:ribosomal protein S18 acetylase RimI-like enzyme